MNETFIPISNIIKRKWYEIDCKNEKLGRIACVCSILLTGKLKPYYHPAFDTGDYVILKNAEYLTFDKKINKFHVFSPGRPGKSFKHLVNVLPEFIIEKCIFNMMPNCFAKRQLKYRLKIYQGPNHPHSAQSPIKLESFDKIIKL